MWEKLVCFVEIRGEFKVHSLDHEHSRDIKELRNVRAQRCIISEENLKPGIGEGCKKLKEHGMM